MDPRVTADYNNSKTVQQNLSYYYNNLETVDKLSPQVSRVIKDAAQSRVVASRLQPIHTATGQTVMSVQTYPIADALRDTADDARDITSRFDYEKASNAMNRYLHHKWRTENGKLKQLQGVTDTKSKIIYLNEQAYQDKLITLAKLSLTLFLIGYSALVMYGWYIGALSGTVTQGLLIVGVVAYMYRFYTTFYVGTFMFYKCKILSAILPSSWYGCGRGAMST